MSLYMYPAAGRQIARLNVLDYQLARRGTLDLAEKTEGVIKLPLYDRTKKADPTPREQANWDRLAIAEIERQRKIRRDEAEGRRGGDMAAKQRMLDLFRGR